MSKSSTLEWIKLHSSMDDLDDLRDVIVERRKTLESKVLRRGKLSFSDILASDIDPDSKLPILTATNIQAGHQYKLTGGQRKFVEEASSLQMTAECTILQVGENEFELAANVAHTIRKGFVRRWICRDAVLFHQQSAQFDIDIIAEKDTKPKKETKSKKSKKADDISYLAAKYMKMLPQ